MKKPTWDIFCQVIDNYGDIGVCWRLAKQLANEHEINVRLWVDEIAAFKMLNPQVLNVDMQVVDKVEVGIWQAEFVFSDVADVVIEAFGCELPQAYQLEMAKKSKTSRAPIWINLEYLSAESWVDECHLKDSFHQPTTLCKTFFFPGFSDKTGGLLRERDILQKRLRFESEKSQQASFLAKLGIISRPQGLIISLFCYPNLSIASLLQAWETSIIPITCLVPPGKSLESIHNQLPAKLCVGETITIGNLTIRAIPFLSQTDYDRLLWSCDINFVRGEDSFVRGQWAAKPMIWQIYPQQQDAHLIKLNAFLQLYTEQTDFSFSTHISELWQNWNNGSNMGDSWNNCIQHFADWQSFSLLWSDKLATKTDLTSALLSFVEKKRY